MKLTKDQEGEKRRIIQLVQSRCKHTRCSYLAKARTFLCLDCGKILYSRR